MENRDTFEFGLRFDTNDHDGTKQNRSLCLYEGMAVNYFMFSGENRSPEGAKIACESCSGNGGISRKMQEDRLRIDDRGMSRSMDHCAISPEGNEIARPMVDRSLAEPLSPLNMARIESL